ncbi:MAG: reverse transcriptase domain-containing protein [Pirellulaceae bacterium]
MAYDQLFKELCKPDVMQVGWHLAQQDSRDDFVTDPIGHADFASNLAERLRHVVEQVQTLRYRPRHLLEIDIPKSGLSVRPGNVLPIEEASLLHAIVYLLAPHLDKKLDAAVFSYRLHPEWTKKVKKRESMFREAPIEFPFLKRKTIRLISPFEAWYELWPDFEAEAIKSYTEEGYTHLTKTDVTAYFENIDLRLLESQIRTLLRREEERILQVLFRVLEGWTRVTSTGSPIGRGIPQGNDISSFFGNLYVVPLDRALNSFCKKRDAKWFRYVDDVKVFTKSERDAREAVFVINDALRALHLNLQGSKTEILSGESLKYELSNEDIEAVDEAIVKVRKLDPDRTVDRKLITEHLKPLASMRSRFTSGLPDSITSLDGKQNRLFRRLMTLYGKCKRNHFRKAAMTALRQLPDMRVLRKSLTYLSQLDYVTHDETLEQLFVVLETGELPFPYQAATVLETIAKLQPADPNGVGSRTRSYALANKEHWLVIQRALEVIAVYPYRPRSALSLAQKFLSHNHPMVRRAACVLLTRSPKDQVRKHLAQLIYHADPGVNRLALYLQRFIRDKEFAYQELARMRKGSKTDFTFQQNMHRLFALSATEENAIAEDTYDFVTGFPVTKSSKIQWLRNSVLELTEWAKV